MLPAFQRMEPHTEIQEATNHVSRQKGQGSQGSGSGAAGPTGDPELVLRM